MENSKQIVKKFERDGFYIARNIIEKKKINNVLENICQIYFKRNSKSKFIKEKKPWKNNGFNKEMTDFHNEKREEFSEIYDGCQSSISATQLVSSAITSKIASLILRCKPIELSHYQNMIRMDSPFNKLNRSAWHQEVQFFYNPGIVLWVPLVEMTEKIGFLNILEKSHLEGEIKFKRNIPNSYATSRLSKCEIPKKILRRYKNKYKLKRVKMKERDALFFSSNLLHSSGENTSKKIRFSCQTRFFNSTSDEFAAFRPKLILNPYSVKKLRRKFF